MQATPTATGLHVAVHDVVQQKVARVKDLGSAARRFARVAHVGSMTCPTSSRPGLPASAGSATRVAYVQGLRNGRLYVIDGDGSVSDARQRRSA